MKEPSLELTETLSLNSLSATSANRSAAEINKTEVSLSPSWKTSKLIIIIIVVQISEVHALLFYYQGNFLSLQYLAFQLLKLGSHCTG